MVYKNRATLTICVFALHTDRRKPLSYKGKSPQHMHGACWLKTFNGATKASVVISMLIGHGRHKLTVWHINDKLAKGCRKGKDMNR